MRFSDFVTIEDNATGYDPDEIISVCKRENNSKRDFLFVQKLQGKHVPAKPSDILEYFSLLCAHIKNEVNWDNHEKVCVVGFAETATAIGRYVADNLPNEVYYLQTTREVRSERQPLFEFQEEHSHATDQIVYGDIDRLKSCERVVFVDDEITTGKTILNFVEQLEQIKKFKYTAASFLNFQNSQEKAKFTKKGIETRALIRGKIKNRNKIIPVKQIPDEYTSNITRQTGKEFLVLGVEEDMYFPLLQAAELEKEHPDQVLFHASTRSPICPAKADDYVIFSRTQFPPKNPSSGTRYIYDFREL